jgi:DNA-binding transcriptional regulator GbsR (MarR family)
MPASATPRRISVLSVGIVLSEISEIIVGMTMSPTTQRFVLHWGEMGGRWGVSRSVAQIHALLYLAVEPVPADVIAETLDIARSAVSVGLRELIGYGIVRLVHVRGDRRDHFEAIGDPWELFVRIVEERRKREIEPTLAVLRECLAEAETDRAAPPAVAMRLKGLLGFIEELDRWYGEMKLLPATTLRALLKMGPAVARVAGVLGGRKASRK